MTHSIAELKTILSPVFISYGISRAVLFGSVAKGTATEKSDLDLLVDSNLRGGGAKVCRLYRSGTAHSRYASGYT